MTIMNKKSKGKLHWHKEHMARQGRTANAIKLPNSTRASGYHMLYESMLLSRWNLHIWWHHTDELDGLSNENWILLAELEAVLFPLSVLSMQVQTDSFGSIACSFIFVFQTFVSYAV